MPNNFIIIFVYCEYAAYQDLVELYLGLVLANIGSQNYYFIIVNVSFFLHTKKYVNGFYIGSNNVHCAPLL